MSKTLENIEGYLFPEYSKRKLHCLSETYGELAKLYKDIPEEKTVIQSLSLVNFLIRIQQTLHKYREILITYFCASLLLGLHHIYMKILRPWQVLFRHTNETSTRKSLT